MITREEYELLKKYRELGYKWIARDANERLYVYRETPMKSSAIWSGTTHIPEKYFTFIKWEDEKPTKIDDLIRDYESHQVMVGENVKVTIPQFVAEWIEEVKGLKRNFKLEYLFDTTAMPDDVYDWLDERYGDTDILARAWLDGFVVEKEKLYTVQLKNGYHLCKYEGTGIKWLNMTEFNAEDCYKLTKGEIESVDPRLMQFAKGVE
ncbi:DUF1642 domain-containing protein [Globicatella sanguinis]